MLLVGLELKDVQGTCPSSRKSCQSMPWPVAGRSLGWPGGDCIFTEDGKKPRNTKTFRKIFLRIRQLRVKSNAI